MSGFHHHQVGDKIFMSAKELKARQIKKRDVNVKLKLNEGIYSNNDVNMKMKLRLLKQYQKRFGKVTTVEVNNHKQPLADSVKPDVNLENLSTSYEKQVHKNKFNPSKSTESNVAHNNKEPDKTKNNNSTSEKNEPEWAEAFDTKTGKSYYYNIKSGITSWAVPGRYIPLDINKKKRPLETSTMNSSGTAASSLNGRKRAKGIKKINGRHNNIERYIYEKSNNYDHITGMTTLVQNDVISSVQVDEDNMPMLNTIQEPRIRVEKWNAETGQFVTSSGASRTGKGKNSIQALAAQAYVLQQGLDKNKKKPGKSLKQSRMKYGW
jgi:hypothetical protein